MKRTSATSSRILPGRPGRREKCAHPDGQGAGVGRPRGGNESGFARAKRAEQGSDRPARADLDPDHRPDGGFDLDRWIDLDEALTRFAAIDPMAAEPAKLRVFGGLSVEGAGEGIGIRRPTAFRTWTYARAWLTSRLADGP